MTNAKANSSFCYQSIAVSVKRNPLRHTEEVTVRCRVTAITHLREQYRFGNDVDRISRREPKKPGGGITEFRCHSPRMSHEITEAC